MIGNERKGNTKKVENSNNFIVVNKVIKAERFLKEIIIKIKIKIYIYI
jgi:hypothetical protein